jgi:hypothetical protein
VTNAEKILSGEITVDSNLQDNHENEKDSQDDEMMYELPHSGTGDISPIDKLKDLIENENNL